ncbi:hypothetical protein EYF80_032613 [Liparis tanakae]|uniref:Uncharacterized protein n=1 Tax=Liparis tanakae TaxID=230148 RepID=A0A4Z2GWN7_9TELE|nr:hypothetical protein EYF80_032613 [Liparis tanakae]
MPLDYSQWGQKLPPKEYVNVLSCFVVASLSRISTRTSSSVPAPFMAFLSSFTAKTRGVSSMARRAFSKLPDNSFFNTSTNS